METPPCELDTIWSAAKMGDVNLLRQLLETQPVDQKDVHDKTPFYYACVYSQVYVLEYLESCYKDQEKAIPTEERKVCSVRTPSEDIWSYLAGHKTIRQVIDAREKAQQIQQMTIFDAAKTACTSKLRQAIKLEPTLITDRDEQHHTPLYYACQYDQPTAVAMLLQPYTKLAPPQEVDEELNACREIATSTTVLQVLDGTLSLQDLMRTQKTAKP